MTRRRFGLSFLAAGLAPAAWLAGQRVARAEHRLTPKAEELQKRAGDLLESLAEDMHHQGERREGSAETAALMAAGTVFGQARAFRLLLDEQGRDADFRLAWSQLAATLEGAEPRILHAHVKRGIRNDWERIQATAEEIDHAMGRVRRPRGRGRR
ncbi:MAG: hypothetical protein HY320_12610 [Armatimonadetes bacterium]|nr:hypothetical protein [Armatimonadota bacterium]